MKNAKQIYLKIHLNAFSVLFIKQEMLNRKKKSNKSHTSDKSICVTCVVSISQYL